MRRNLVGPLNTSIGSCPVGKEINARKNYPRRTAVTRLGQHGGGDQEENDQREDPRKGRASVQDGGQLGCDAQRSMPHQLTVGRGWYVMFDRQL